MKTGILTFCNAYNLGGALQSFSLQKALEELGVDAELIDYRCPAIEKMHKRRPVFQTGIGIKARGLNLMHNIVFRRRRRYYKNFQKMMRKSKQYTRETVSETNSVYDLFITGSDQVFNYKLTEGDSTYFLDFVEGKPKASYAASMGVYFPERADEYKRYLSSFRYLSVREKSTATILQTELGISAELMPDPVFLHTAEEWKKLLGVRDGEHKDRYVLVYALIEKKELYRIARKVAAEKKLKVYAITKVLKPAGQADKLYRNVGPKEFIGLLADAEYVVTNSFHGTAFSLIFEKQFTTLIPPNAPDRVKDLLSDMGLSDRAVTAEIESEPDSIRYDEVRKKMVDYADKGRDYLRVICDR